MAISSFSMTLKAAVLEYLMLEAVEGIDSRFLVLHQFVQAHIGIKVPAFRNRFLGMQIIDGGLES